jgi:hypothetical protein
MVIEPTVNVALLGLRKVQGKVRTHGRPTFRFARIEHQYRGEVKPPACAQPPSIDASGPLTSLLSLLH